MYAIVEQGSKQYKVAVGDQVEIELTDVAPDAKTIDLDKVLEDAMDGQIPAQVFLAVLIFCSHGNILRLLPLIFRLLKKGLARRDPKARAVLSGCLFYLDKAPDSEFAKLQQLLHEFKAKDAQLVQEREVSLENAAMNAANS